jgi:hypothetical protein
MVPPQKGGMQKTQRGDVRRTGGLKQQAAMTRIYNAPSEKDTMIFGIQGFL